MKKLAINPSNKKYYSDDYIKGWENGVNAQYEATKDAVEVVRCKDCRWAEKAILGEYCVECTMYHTSSMRHGYCHHGERREEDEQ